jgi:hypothetical protein
MQKLKQILTRVIDWCKRHPILSSIVGLWLAGMCYIINWPPIPILQPLAWDAWYYISTHDREGQKFYKLNEVVYKTLDPSLLETYFDNLIKPGTHYLKAREVLEKENFRCSFREFSVEQYSSLKKDSKSLQCELSNLSDSRLSVDIKKRIDYISVEYDLSMFDLTVLDPSEYVDSREIYFNHSGYETNETEIAIDEIVETYIYASIPVKKAETTLKKNGFRCYYSDRSEHQDGSEKHLSCHLDNFGFPIKLPTIVGLIEPGYIWIDLDYSKDFVTHISTNVR